ncbi:MAG: hypothetical protein H6581_28425 [Bacteroidia bacterium]|nr:hypothetical protein [Bacteroidia bacterium]
MILPILVLALGYQALGQNFYSKQNQLRFIEHLDEVGESFFAEIQCNKLIKIFQDDTLFVDSLQWQRLKICLNEENSTSSLSWNKFSSLSPSFRERALILQNTRYFPHKSGFNSDLSPFDTLRNHHFLPYLVPYQQMLLGAFALTERNPEPFLHCKNAFLAAEPGLKTNIQAVELAWNRYAHQKPRSPAVAGLMSAIVPGSGKIYAGNTFSGVVTLITSATLGLQAWEGWHKSDRKFRDPQFIIYGAAFLGYYTANIFGSIWQTKKYNVRLQTDFHQQVAVLLVVPLEQSVLKLR